MIRRLSFENCVTRPLELDAAATARRLAKQAHTLKLYGVGAKANEALTSASTRNRWITVFRRERLPRYVPSQGRPGQIAAFDHPSVRRTAGGGQGGDRLECGLGFVLKDILPTQAVRTYASANICIYCGATERLSDEHIIPLGLGGRLVLPRASCGKCAALTSAFEGTVLRTMFGPLRMFYDMPSRRKSKRPATLPLKVKLRAGDDWTHLEVEREQYPFLVLIPYLSAPTFLGGRKSDACPGASRFWIRGASIGEGFKPHLQDLCDKLGVHAVMPTAEARVPEFCLMLAKIAHAYAAAECGRDAAEWILPAAILARDVSDRATVMGSITRLTPPSHELHELDLVEGPGRCLSVRVQLLAVMDTPTYLVHVGHRMDETVT